MYELDEGRIRLAFSASQLNMGYSPEYSPPLTDAKNGDFGRWVISIHAADLLRSI